QVSVWHRLPSGFRLAQITFRFPFGTDYLQVSVWHRLPSGFRLHRLPSGFRLVRLPQGFVNTVADLPARLLPLLSACCRRHLARANGTILKITQNRISVFE
ncbi:hypothetical protein, partial [Methanimicrococcus hacksteinii]|uniref:hypothetical protein n=1 Tax=Methanimicrococcus hacksteinii TaxID=3028293 RepID=UPI00298EF012